VATDDDRPTEECTREDRVALATLALAPEAAVGAPATESACRARIELASAIGTTHQLARIGRPTPFPDGLPEQYREAGFGRVARVVVSACPELHADLRKVDCSEFPCLALYVQPSDAPDPSSCSAWSDAFHETGVTSSSGVLVGEDGERLRFSLMGPKLPEGFEPPPDPPLEVEDVPMSNAMARLRQRGQDARDEVIDALGAREMTEAEQRDVQRAFWSEAAKTDPRAATMLDNLEESWAKQDAKAPEESTH
jgi:hypothetical protein